MVSLQLLLQVQHQLIEGRRAHRVEPGSGLIEKQQRRIERQGAGDRDAFHHAAGELRGVLVRRIGRQADQADLEQRELIEHARLELQVLDHGQLHVLQHRQPREQRPLLEGDAVAGLDRAQLRRAHAGDVGAVDAHHPGLRALQPEDAPQQHRLARARAADDAEHLVPLDLHVEPVVNHLGAEAVDQPVHFEQRIHVRCSSS